jgi:Arc/MetJ-type ribon-helix-helix transcriptional regulator
MQEDMALVSFRLPRKMNLAFEAHAKERGFASKTEALRDAIRKQLYEDAADAVAAMKGALKGKVKLPRGGMRTIRRRMWEEDMKEAGGDMKKAFAIMKRKENEAAKRLGL